MFNQNSVPIWRVSATIMEWSLKQWVDWMTTLISSSTSLLHCYFRKRSILVKANSSSWMKDYVQNFEWQEGYGAFSVSASNLTPVEKYIRNQDRYHRKITFEREFIALLKKHNIEFDPRYVFG